MSDKMEGGRVFFARSRRAPDRDSEIRLISAGVDIGSSTSHLAFSRLTLRRNAGRARVVRRELLHESDILLTPYADSETIDTEALGRFIGGQYEKAEIMPEMIDTGALILTGLAARTSNAHAIGNLFAMETGRFVSVTAGDALETRLCAHGSGAVAASADEAMRIINLDIGGGTSKIAMCANGEIEALTAIDIGARLIRLDAQGRVSHIQPQAKAFGLRLGDSPPAGAFEAIAEHMAQCLFEACGGEALSESTRALLRLPPLPLGQLPDQISFSGGVAEYVHGREARSFGDLGSLLADAVLARMRGWGPAIRFADAGIRATVIGASQYSVQLSGNTIFVDPAGILPLRNLPVIVPAFAWGDVVEPEAIASAMTAALARCGASGPVAVGYRWQGDASHARIVAFCQGIVRALSGPLVLVGERDIGGLIGAELRAHSNGEAVVSIDGISVRELDYIDIGELLLVSGGVPVVVKSLVF